MTSVPTPSKEPFLVELRTEFDAIDQVLETAQTQPDREKIKRRIIALFKRTDGTLQELTELKDSIRSLVERYKQGGVPAPTPMGSEVFATKPVVHEDHIGASTFIEKGWNLISLGDHPGAIKALTKATELAPNDVQGHSLLGWAQMLNEAYDDALGTFSRVLMKEPNNALARVNVGYICLKKQIFGEAIEHLSRALRLDNDRKATLYANYYLGLVYFERQMYGDAESFLRKAVALGPNLIEAYYDLGRALWHGGDQAAAKSMWEAGIAANRHAPWAERCQALLDRVAAGQDIPGIAST